MNTHAVYILRLAYLIENLRHLLVKLHDGGTTFLLNKASTDCHLSSISGNKHEVDARDAQNKPYSELWSTYHQKALIPLGLCVHSKSSVKLVVAVTNRLKCGDSASLYVIECKWNFMNLYVCMCVCRWSLC